MSDLSLPVYPPGTPAHTAFYLAVDADPERARDFYTRLLGGAPDSAEFLAAEPAEAGPQWEVVVGVVRPAWVADSARRYGASVLLGGEDRQEVRLIGPEGLVARLRALD